MIADYVSYEMIAITMFATMLLMLLQSISIFFKDLAKTFNLEIK